MDLPSIGTRQLEIIRLSGSNSFEPKPALHEDRLSLQTMRPRRSAASPKTWPNHNFKLRLLIDCRFLNVDWFQRLGAAFFVSKGRIDHLTLLGEPAAIRRSEVVSIDKLPYKIAVKVFLTKHTASRRRNSKRNIRSKRMAGKNPGHMIHPEFPKSSCHPANSI